MELLLSVKMKCCFQLYSPNSWGFRTISQLATCDDRRPRTGRGLSPYSIIAPSGKRRQMVELVRAIATISQCAGIAGPVGELPVADTSTNILSYQCLASVSNFEENCGPVLHIGHNVLDLWCILFNHNSLFISII
ncbi:hypothetical protein TNCV_4622581 [Trichonephila clavipes]|nr:hypothetical protein TNCV_4622581 [Trichonephila clavipes]